MNKMSRMDGIPRPKARNFAILFILCILSISSCSGYC